MKGLKIVVREGGALLSLTGGQREGYHPTFFAPLSRAMGVALRLFVSGPQGELWLVEARGLVRRPRFLSPLHLEEGEIVPDATTAWPPYTRMARQVCLLRRVGEFRRTVYVVARPEGEGYVDCFSPVRHRPGRWAWPSTIQVVFPDREDAARAAEAVGGEALVLEVEGGAVITAPDICGPGLPQGATFAYWTFLHLESFRR